MDNAPRHFSVDFASNISKDPRRKWSITNGSTKPQSDSSLVLGLGEIEEESSIGLGLGINSHVGNDRILDPKSISFGTPRVDKPKLDLELSLSTGPAESDVTTVIQESFPLQNAAATPVSGGMIQLVDEGSTSSRWKLRPLVSPLQSNETITPFDHVDAHIYPTSIIPNLSVACVSGVNHHQQRRNPSLKTCQFQGCTRGARGASGLCIAHGGGQRCQRAGCHKGAEGKTVFCKAHGGGRRCQHLGCTKSAEGRTDYCIGHGGGRRCSHDGCTRAARGKSGLCIRHGGGKRCKMENCTKSAEGISGLCISHGGGRRCHYPDCPKGAQGGTMFCKAHGGGKRCIFLGCTKGAEGSTSFCKAHGGGKRCTFEGGCTKSVHGGTLFCVNHGGGKRCAVPECTKSARGRTNFCVRHGGGKRCKFEGCGKSAQGRTDFCKAHGGGKRCSWGLFGSEFGDQAAAPCDKFARGKSGLCVAHSAQVQDKQTHGGNTSGSTMQDPKSSTIEKMNAIFAAENNHTSVVRAAGAVGTSNGFMGYGHQLISMQIPFQDNGIARVGQLSLPEGRVHGGNLMAMLRGSTSFGPSNKNQVVGNASDPGKFHYMPHSWVYK